MTLEPHHAAGRTRSWREVDAIAAWESTRVTRRDLGDPDMPNRDPDAPCASVCPAQTVQKAPGVVGDAQTLSARQADPSGPEETP